MNIYTDIVQPIIQGARGTVPWPRVDERRWFPRENREPQEVKFVAWFDRTWRCWRVGKVDGLKAEYWGCAWVHVTTEDHATKWLRWDEVPWVQ